MINFKIKRAFEIAEIPDKYLPKFLEVFGQIDDILLDEKFTEDVMEELYRFYLDYSSQIHTEELRKWFLLNQDSYEVLYEMMNYKNGVLNGSEN